MSDKRKISNIASVFSGAYFKDFPDGGVNYLQVKDFNDTKDTAYTSVELNERTRKHLLSEGDLLFAAKGTCNFCVVFHDRMGQSIASSSFLVLKIKDKKSVDPEYLCWFLNRDDVLLTLKSNAVGSSIPSISKSTMEEYEVVIPPLVVQHKIMEIEALQKKEQELYAQIAQRRNSFIEKQIIKIIQNK